jgi:hypothetical protein
MRGKAGVFQGRWPPPLPSPSGGGSKSDIYSFSTEGGSKNGIYSFSTEGGSKNGIYSFPRWGKVGMGACGA